MKLQELLKGVAVLSSTADGEAEIGEVRYDSRAVGKGDLFVKGIDGDYNNVVGLPLARVYHELEELVSEE